MNQKIKKVYRKFLSSDKTMDAAIAPCSFSPWRNALPLAAPLFLKKPSVKTSYKL
jgi:hypothetical protein